MINVLNLKKNFGKHTVLADISFHVDKGQFVGLLGPNGAGKTTTLHTLLGLITPTSGKIEICGYDLAKDRRKILSLVNYSSAYVSLPANLTIQENMFLFSKLYGVKDHKARIKEVFEIVDFNIEQDRLVGSLSSGQKTRLNIAKSLLNHPQVIFLDEPTASLDPDSAERIRTSLKRIQQIFNTTILYTSHQMEEVNALCDSIIFLNEGRVLYQGLADEIVKTLNVKNLEDAFIKISRGLHDF